MRSSGCHRTMANQSVKVGIPQAGRHSRRTLVLMCSSFEIFASFAFVGMLACMVIGLSHESRFVAYIEKNHPTIWGEIAKQGKLLRPEDGNYSYAGVQWHLILCGGYKNIADPRAQKLGRNARLVSIAAGTCLCLVGLYATLAQNFPSLGCVVPWL